MIEPRFGRSRRIALASLLTTAALIAGGMFATSAAATTSSAPPETVSYETYVLSGVTFSDGGTASGFINMDSAGTVYDFSLSVAGGDTATFPAMTYSPASGYAGYKQTATEEAFMQNVGTLRFLDFAGVGLIGPAGNHTVTLDTTGTSRECFNCFPYRTVTGGTAVGSPTLRTDLFTTSSDARTLAWGDSIPLSVDWGGNKGAPSDELSYFSIGGQTVDAYLQRTNPDGTWNYSWWASNPLTPGTYPVSVSYGGDPHYYPTTQSLGSVTVTKAESQLQFSAPASASPNTPVSISATVSPAFLQAPNATGEVTFTSNGNTIGVVPLASDGTAHLTTANLPTGVDALTATYSGDGNYSTGTTGTSYIDINVTTPAVPSLSAPRSVRAAPGDRTLVISFQPPANNGGSAIAGYRLSLDGGRSFAKVTPGRAVNGLQRISLVGLRNGARYRVVLAAVNRAGAVARSAVVTTSLNRWFTDDLQAAQRHAELATPLLPARYHGALHYTSAYHRSHNGTIAIAPARLRGRQLQSGEAVSLGTASEFSFDSSILTVAGKAEVRSLTASLRYVAAVTCEGYSDYGNQVTHQQALSLARARTVCAQLVRDGVRISTNSVGYGGNHVAIVGGQPAQRAANRRVVVVITK